MSKSTPPGESQGDVDLLSTDALSVSPEGAYTASRAHTEQPGAGEATLLFDLRDLQVRAWLAGRPLLWIDRQGRPGLIVGTPEASGPGGVAEPAVVDPATLARTPLPLRAGDVLATRPSGGDPLMTASPDKRLFTGVVGSSEGGRALGLWSTADLRATARFDLDRSAIREIGFDRTGSHVFARDANDRLFVFDLNTGTERTVALGEAIAAARATGIAGAVVKMTDLDTHAVLVATPDTLNLPTRAAVIDYRTDEIVASLQGYPVALFAHRGAVLWSAGGGAVDVAGRLSYLRLGSADGEAPAIWDLGEADLGSEGRREGWASGHFSLSPDGRRLYSGQGWWKTLDSAGSDAESTVWVTGYPPSDSWFESFRFSDIRLSRDGRRFAYHVDTPGTAGYEAVLDFGKWGFRKFMGSAAFNAGLLDRLAGQPPKAPCPPHPMRADQPSDSTVNPLTTSCYAWAQPRATVAW